MIRCGRVFSSFFKVNSDEPAQRRRPGSQGELVTGLPASQAVLRMRAGGKADRLPFPWRPQAGWAGAAC